MSCTEIIKSFLHYILRLVFQILLYIINADEPLLCMVCIVYLEVAQILEDNFTDISTIVQYKSCMYGSGELFLRSRDCYFSDYSPSCESTKAK